MVQPRGGRRGPWDLVVELLPAVDEELEAVLGALHRSDLQPRDLAAELLRVGLYDEIHGLGEPGRQIYFQSVAQLVPLHH